MSYDSTFTPQGPMVLVSNVVAVQALSTNLSEQSMSYRIRCLATGYLAWSTPQITTPPPTLTATAPTTATPAVNTIGMTLGGVETFTLPVNAWFISSVASGFEVTPGQGM